MQLKELVQTGLRVLSARISGSRPDPGVVEVLRHHAPANVDCLLASLRAGLFAGNPGGN